MRFCRKVPTQLQEYIHEDIKSYLEAALKYSGNDHSVDDVLRECLNERYELYVLMGDEASGIKGVVVTHTYQLPQQKVFEVTLMASDIPMESLKDDLLELEQTSTEQGCTQSRIIGRKGWGGLLPDYTPKATIFVKQLTSR